MVNQQVLSGQWNELRGKLKEKWGKLSDDDLRSFNGNVDQLVGRIQQKTGETREAIERFLSQVSEEGSDYLATARDRVQAAAGQVADQMQQGYEGLRQGYAEAERIVQQRPGQAVAVAFGIGLLAGIGATLLLHERTGHVTIDQGRRATEKFGRQVLDSLAAMLPDALKHTRG